MAAFYSTVASGDHTAHCPSWGVRGGAPTLRARVTGMEECGRGAWRPHTFHLRGSVPHELLQETCFRHSCPCPAPQVSPRARSPWPGGPAHAAHERPPCGCITFPAPLASCWELVCAGAAAPRWAPASPWAACGARIPSQCHSDAQCSCPFPGKSVPPAPPGAVSLVGSGCLYVGCRSGGHTWWRVRHSRAFPPIVWAGLANCILKPTRKTGVCFLLQGQGCMAH